MITHSRLAHQVSSKIDQDPIKNNLMSNGVLESGSLPSDSLLSGGYLGQSNSALGKSNTFDQLLQLANINSDKNPKTDTKKNANEVEQGQRSAERQDAAKSKAREKKPERETAQTQAKKKNADDKKSESGSAELAQLLSNQHMGAFKPSQTETKSVAMKSADQTIHTAAQVSASSADLNKLTLEQPKNLADTIRNLEQKVEKMNLDVQTNQSVTGTPDELRELSEKFDSVQMEFSTNTQPTGAQYQLTRAQLEDAQLSKENLLKMMRQDIAEGDAALRDFLKLSAAQNSLAESQAAEKLALLQQMKSSQLDQMNLNEIRQDALLAQQQLRELSSGQPSQWKSLDEMSLGQLTMLDSLSGVNSGTNSESLKGFVQNVPAAVQGRLAGQESEQSKVMNSTQNVLDNNSMFTAMNNEGAASNSFSRNNSSFSGNTNRGEVSPLSQATSGKIEDVDFAGQEKAQQAKADARARESERTREMARAAAQRAQTIAAELATKGGGTARVQIKDSQLGVVELRINMADNNRMNVQLVANSDRIKQELEKHAEALKDGLEKHQLVVEGVNFSTDMTLGESSFQSNTQNENQNQQQPQSQNQQGFGSFQQNNSGQGQGRFEQERLFEPQQMAGLTNNTPQKQSRQNYAATNDVQTNIQRSANGSLKVTA